MKTILIAIVAGVIGFLICYLTLGKQDTAYHWNIVHSYHDLYYDSSTQKYDEENKMYYFDVDIALPASLEALVASGELIKVSLIFPNVPYTPESLTRWMEYCNDNKDFIMEAIATPEQTGTGTVPSGVKPFNCVIYYLPGHSEIIENMIKHVEREG